MLSEEYCKIFQKDFFITSNEKKPKCGYDLVVLHKDIYEWPNISEWKTIVPNSHN